MKAEHIVISTHVSDADNVLVTFSAWTDVKTLEYMVGTLQRAIDTHHAQRWADHLEGASDD